MADSLFDVRAFMRNIINGYKERFHWPKKRDSCHVEVTSIHIAFIVAIILVIAFAWWMNAHVGKTSAQLQDSRYK
jgi:uncharacterized membrane protein (DUF485 family)